MIELRDYQKEAIKKAVRVGKVLLCMATGCGKTIISIFLARYLLNKDLSDKIIVGCTLSSTNVFIDDFKDKVNYNVKMINDMDSFMNFLEGRDKVCIIKHNFIKELGFVKDNIVSIKKVLKKNKIRICLILDEAHVFNNTSSQVHEAYDNIRGFFDRVVLLTATPYTSCLSQLYGLTHLLYKKLWSSKRAFTDLYIDEFRKINRETGRVEYKQVTRYKNLKDLRERIEPFTYFYFPKINLNFISHRVKLEDYTQYDFIAQGFLDMDEKDLVGEGNDCMEETFNFDEE